MADRGSVVVEAAIIVPLLLLVFLAGVELFGVARTQVELTAAAREGARQAATSSDPARAVRSVRAALGPATRSDAAVSVRRPGVVGAVATVSVRLEYPFVSFLWGGVRIPLRASASMRTER
ncbi:MAG: pilus assembly protein [Acidimicrobiia bacterium]|nr:pilus assembly protein [Acidimicrobiia bacterium]NND12645.1 pilus assembly protein [Acidimicrobiia bacterium]NNL28758.1 pilus assembly protein [Acidimicrobiia bacterium]